MNSNVISERLINLRGKRSRQEIADKIGVSLSALIKYERGERIPRDEVKIKLAEEYNTTVQDIFF